MNAAETTTVLRELVARFPIPEGRWHRYADAMVACRRDFAAAIDVIEADERAQAELERLIQAEELPPPPAGGAVGAALERLDALPRPEGQHPFIAEIEPTLDAMRVALHAVAASEDATRSFDARLSL